MTMAGLMALMALAPLAGSSQVTPPGAGQRQRMELERRLQQGFQRTVQTQLNLGDEELQSLRAIMQSFQEDRSRLNRAQASLRYRLRDPALQDISEEDARALLAEMVQLQEEELDLYRREQAQLLTVLTPLQLVKFYRLRDTLGQRVQELRLGRGRGGGGLGPPGGVGPGGSGGIPGRGGGRLR
jgi:Spy/CpxP family protein refolding chaperone